MIARIAFVLGPAVPFAMEAYAVAAGVFVFFFGLGVSVTERKESQQ